jgi:hypothetical protein
MFRNENKEKNSSNTNFLEDCSTFNLNGITNSLHQKMNVATQAIVNTLNNGNNIIA